MKMPQSLFAFEFFVCFIDRP